MLEVRDLRAGYGAINVLWDVSLTFPQSALTTIVGPNGAGKTTLLRAIMGLASASAGSITLDGQNLRSRSTWDLPEIGLALVPEGRMLFREMTVEENLILGAFPKRRRRLVASSLEQVYGLFPRLEERRSQLAGALSGGEAQMVAIGRGLMSDPRILLIDEPSLGLSPKMATEIFAILKRLKGAGVTIVLVEQNTHMALALADHVYLMRSGRVLLREPAAKVDPARLQALYFAREAGPRPHASTEGILITAEAPGRAVWRPVSRAARRRPSCSCSAKPSIGGCRLAFN